MAKQKPDAKYDSMIKAASPDSPLLKDMVFAFVSGGAICAAGEALREWYFSMGLSETSASSAVSITLILIASALTAMGLFEKIAKFAGAGTLVPITGFSNAMTSPAMEFRADGLVLGVGAKMFVVAGPVIVYGVLSSFVAGIVYYILSR